MHFPLVICNADVNLIKGDVTVGQTPSSGEMPNYTTDLFTDLFSRCAFQPGLRISPELCGSNFPAIRRGESIPHGCTRLDGCLDSVCAGYRLKLKQKMTS